MGPAAHGARLKPQVSCVLAVNRDDGFLEEAIRSVLDQEGINFELLLVANNCTDGLWEDLQKWSDPRVRLFRTSIGQLPFNLNYGVDQARAPYIARMDADDICEPRRFVTQWERFQARSDLDVLGSGYRTIDTQGRPGPAFKPLLTNEAIRRGFRRECQIAHPTVMFKRSTFLRHHGYAYGLFGEDYDLWLRMRRDPSVVFENLEQPLLRYREHDQQMSSSSRAGRSFAELMPLFLREFWLTGEPGFLAGLARKWFLSSALWRRLLRRPFKALRDGASS